MKEFIKIEESLLENIKDFISKNKITRSHFGEQACNDPKIVMRLEKGKSINSGTINAIRKYISEHGVKEVGDEKRV